jgi:hypothetical protein
LRRLPLGRCSDFSGRQRVYEGREALEIDDFEGYAGQRRRVFYDEVLLVTRHRRVGWPLALLMLGLALFFAVFAGILALANQVTPALGMGFAAVVPLLGFAVLRMAVKMHVVTVYGRRSQARVQFWLQDQRAGRVFQRICARVRQAQARTVPASVIEGGP